jgi:hypothetical protein
MFDDVAAGYDVTNNLLSAGNALLWRIATTRAVNPQATERVLDLLTPARGVSKVVRTSLPLISLRNAPSGSPEAWTTP